MPLEDTALSRLTFPDIMEPLMLDEQPAASRYAPSIFREFPGDGNATPDSNSERVRRTVASVRFVGIVGKPGPFFAGSRHESVDSIKW